MTDDDVLARFETRLSAIEVEIGEPPAWRSELVRDTVGRVRPGPMARRSPGIAMILVPVVVVVALIAVSNLVRQAPRTVPGASSSTTVATRSPGILMGSNGLPVSIDGETVLVGSEAKARAGASPDPTPFLVGGWLYDGKALCPAGAVPTGPELLQTGWCGIWPALEPSPTSDPNDSQSIWTIFLPGFSPAEPIPPSGNATPEVAVVLRVHTHDPAAIECPITERAECGLAVIVDTVEWTSLAPQPSASPLPPVSALPLDYFTQGCAGGSRLAVLELANGPAFWTAFPRSGLAPELTQEESPLVAVVYLGAYPGMSVGLGAIRSPDPGTWDVCVETLDARKSLGGTSWLVYGDIPWAGSVVAHP
jgi:hypothetical protein